MPASVWTKSATLQLSADFNLRAKLGWAGAGFWDRSPQLEFSCDGVRNLTSAEMKITSATEEPMAGGSPAEEVGRATAKVGMGCGRFLAESFVNRPWPRDFVLH